MCCIECCKPCCLCCCPCCYKTVEKQDQRYIPMEGTETNGMSIKEKKFRPVFCIISSLFCVGIWLVILFFLLNYAIIPPVARAIGKSKDWKAMDLMNQAQIEQTKVLYHHILTSEPELHVMVKMKLKQSVPVPVDLSNLKVKVDNKDMTEFLDINMTKMHIPAGSQPEVTIQPWIKIAYFTKMIGLLPQMWDGNAKVHANVDVKAKALGGYINTHITNLKATVILPDANWKNFKMLMSKVLRRRLANGQYSYGGHLNFNYTCKENGKDCPPLSIPMDASFDIYDPRNDRTPIGFYNSSNVMKGMSNGARSCPNQRTVFGSRQFGTKTLILKGPLEVGKVYNASTRKYEYLMTKTIILQMV